ncbi:MAG TPA: NADH-quinone oxidoreductase subunit I [Phycisphaerae bacterium]|nr:NADH-quinone oxidoreductase subunit I [Phycisphaerae bacterium]HNU46616.1 NADH-quinone oxidoreductase subunit I [Phycisphaerae bacterium]
MSSQKDVMHAGPGRDYFHNIAQTVKSILIGMRITLKYCFAKTVTVQYPDVAPTLQPRFRGFHYYEIEKCIACDACAKACPVDCIYIDKTAPRKIDKETGVAVGGALVRYAIDYSKCMFCALCTEPCPTDCIHMGNVHDMSAYTRENMIVEFTELAKQGLQTPQPLWMSVRRHVPQWATDRQREWQEYTHSADGFAGQPEKRREAMLKALTEQEAPKKKPAAKKEGDAAEAAPKDS